MILNILFTTPTHRRAFISIRRPPQRHDCGTLRYILENFGKSSTAQVPAVATPDMPPKILKTMSRWIDQLSKRCGIDCNAMLAEYWISEAYPVGNVPCQYSHIFSGGTTEKLATSAYTSSELTTIPLGRSIGTGMAILNADWGSRDNPQFSRWAAAEPSSAVWP